MGRLAIGIRMLIVFALIALAQGGMSLIDLQGFGRSNDDISEIYEQRLIPVSSLARINDLMHVSIEQLTIAVIARPSPSNLQKYTDRVEASLKEIDALARDYAQHAQSEEGKKLLSEWMSERDALIAKGIKPAISSLKAQAFDDAEDTVLGVAVKRFEAVQRLFDAIVERELATAKGTHEAADARYSLTRYLTVGGLLFALGLCALMAFYVNRSVASPLAAMTAAMRRLASGEREIAIPATRRKDEIGQMAAAVEVFKQGLIDAEQLTAQRLADQADKRRRQELIDRHVAEFDRSIRKTLDTLTAASGEMNATASKMSL